MSKEQIPLSPLAKGLLNDTNSLMDRIGTYIYNAESDKAKTKTEANKAKKDNSDSLTPEEKQIMSTRAIYSVVEGLGSGILRNYLPEAEINKLVKDMKEGTSLRLNQVNSQPDKNAIKLDSARTEAALKGFVLPLALGGPADELSFYNLNEKERLTAFAITKKALLNLNDKDIPKQNYNKELQSETAKVVETLRTAKEIINIKNDSPEGKMKFESALKQLQDILPIKENLSKQNIPPAQYEAKLREETLAAINGVDFGKEKIQNYLNFIAQGNKPPKVSSLNNDEKELLLKSTRQAAKDISEFIKNADPDAAKPIIDQALKNRIMNNTNISSINSDNKNTDKTSREMLSQKLENIKVLWEYNNFNTTNLNKINYLGNPLAINAKTPDEIFRKLANDLAQRSTPEQLSKLSSEIKAQLILDNSLKKLGDKKLVLNDAQIKKVIDKLEPVLSKMNSEYLTANNDKLVNSLTKALDEQKSFTSRFSKNFEISSANLDKIAQTIIKENPGASLAAETKTPPIATMPPKAANAIKPMQQSIPREKVESVAQFKNRANAQQSQPRAANPIKPVQEKQSGVESVAQFKNKTIAQKPPPKAANIIRPIPPNMLKKNEELKKPANNFKQNKTEQSAPPRLKTPPMLDNSDIQSILKPSLGKRVNIHEVKTKNNEQMHPSQTPGKKNNPRSKTKNVGGRE